MARSFFAFSRPKQDSRAFWAALAVAFPLVALGCGRKAGAGTDGGTSVTLTFGEQKRGLEADGNDARVVALARAALACPRGSEASSFFDTSCAGYQEWTDDKTFKSANVDATFVSMVEDGDERVRWLGARGLSSGHEFEKPYQTDPALATRLVAAAAVETSKPLWEPLGGRLSRIDVQKTGVLDPIVAIAKKHEKVEMIAALAEHFLFTNSSDRPTYDFMLGLTNDPNPHVRSVAVDAFWPGGHLSNGETCKMWDAHLEDPDDAIASNSAMLLGWYHSCAAQYDTLLTSLENRVKAGRTAHEGRFADAPGKMCADHEATPTQKHRGAELSRSMLANRALEDWVRGAAVASVVACDPKGGRAFVAKFAHDKQSYVRSSVKAALAKK